ncbi:MAG: penicillin-binding protein 2 [Chloroflexota bacterium]|nr:penicillin-binding protein 2 [Chloroflexota bacterium]
MADLNEGRLDLPRSRPRFIAFTVTALLLFTLLGGRLFQMQVMNGTLYADRAAAGRTVDEAIKAPRGLIFDRAGRPVAVNIPSWTVDAIPADLPGKAAARTAVLSRVASTVGAKLATLTDRLNAYRGSPYDRVPLLREVSRDQALILAEAANDLPGIVVDVDPVREYLDEAGKVDGSLLAHVLGYTGRISQDQLKQLAAQGYLPDDVTGEDGVEASYESLLRGTYGTQQVERDAAGRPIKVVSTSQQPVGGANLMLTIDARLQRMATDALTWGMRAAGVKQGVTIVLNPQTGEILAMVSLPTYDNNAFATGITNAEFQAYVNNPNQPLRNHAIADIYPPGSTFKLVTGTAALQQGVTTPTKTWPTYACYHVPGAPANQCLFDWNRAGFGRLNIRQAYAKSSDTFFYQMAVHLGIDPLAKWAHDFGFGSRTGIKLPGEAAGIIASTAWAQSQGRPTVFTGELAQAGIGQNVIAVTPLQLANAYAALANGGRLMQPMIVKGETDDAGKLVKAFQPTLLHKLASSSANLQVMRLGAREVITTGHAFNIRDVPLPGTLSGKTGTAEFGEKQKNGSLPFHSWFVGWLPSHKGGTDATLEVLTFSYSATVPGNVSTEVVKYFLQEYFKVQRDYRLNPRTLSLLGGN